MCLTAPVTYLHYTTHAYFCQDYGGGSNTYRLTENELCGIIVIGEVFGRLKSRTYRTFTSVAKGGKDETENAVKETKA